HDEVSAHDVTTGDALAAPVSYDERTRAREIPESVDGLLGPPLLDDGDDDDEDDHREERDRLHRISEQEVQPPATSSRISIGSRRTARTVRQRGRRREEASSFGPSSRRRREASSSV